MTTPTTRLIEYYEAGAALVRARSVERDAYARFERAKNTLAKEDKLIVTIPLDEESG